MTWVTDRFGRDGMRDPLRGVAAALGLVGLLGGAFLWWSLSSQRFECEVCVEFEGRRNCATASAASEGAAARAAQATACGTLARGRIDLMRCGGIRPLSRRCRKL
jgi:hypothetical protein